MIKVIANDPKRKKDAKKLEKWLSWLETNGFMTFNVDHHGDEVVKVNGIGVSELAPRSCAE